MKNWSSQVSNVGSCIKGSAVHQIRNGSWSHVLPGGEAEVAGKPVGRRWVWKEDRSPIQATFKAGTVYPGRASRESETGQRGHERGLI